MTSLLQRNNELIVHIAFLIPDLRGGGAQKMLINLANWFATKGIRTDLIIINSAGNYAGLISPQVTVKSFGKSRSFYAIFSLIRYMRRDRPDVMFSALFYINIILLFAQRLAGVDIKTVISERNHMTRSFASYTSILKHFWLKIIRFIYPKASHIIGISDGVCDDLKTLLPPKTHHKIETIYNPVVTSSFDDSSSKVISLFPEWASVKIIASGRLVPQKDYPTMLNAFARYLKGNPNAYLVILGTGILENQIHDLSEQLGLNDNIQFAGFIDNPLAAMQEADVFLMTSQWEGFGNVIVEALHCGLKIVVTDCPSGPAEILANGKHGILCPVGDADEVANALAKVERIQSNPEQQKKRAGDFHVDMIGNQFLARFKNLVS